MNRHWLHRRVSFSARTNVTALRLTSNASDVTEHRPTPTRRIHKWKFVLTNTGNAFDANTGVVTSPYTATYTFLLDLAAKGRVGSRAECENSARVRLVSEERDLVSLTTTRTDNEQTTFVSASYTVAMRRGERLWCELDELTPTSNRKRCRFEVTFRGFTE